MDGATPYYCRSVFVVPYHFTVLVYICPMGSQLRHLCILGASVLTDGLCKVVWCKHCFYTKILVGFCQKANDMGVVEFSSESHGDVGRDHHQSEVHKSYMSVISESYCKAFKIQVAAAIQEDARRARDTPCTLP